MEGLGVTPVATPNGIDTRLDMLSSSRRERAGSVNGKPDPFRDWKNLFCIRENPRQACGVLYAAVLVRARSSGTSSRHEQAPL